MVMLLQYNRPYRPGYIVTLYNLIGQISQDDIVGLTLLQSDRPYRPGNMVTLQQSDR